MNAENNLFSDGVLTKLNYRLLLEYKTPNSAPCTPAETERFRYFVDNNLVRIHSSSVVSFSNPSIPSALCPAKWVITAKGQDALLAFEQETEKQSQEKRDRRFDKKISVLNLLVPLITFFIGLFVEHSAGVVEWFLSFFHNITP